MSFAKYSGVMALLLLTACDIGSGGESSAARELPTSQPGNLLRLGNATRAGGDLNAAEKLYKEAIAKGKDSPAPYLALANLYQTNGQPLKAVSTLEDGVKSQKDNPELSLALANLLIGNGSSSEALKYAQLAITLDPENPRAYNTQGVALDNAGRYDEAQVSYGKGIKLAGENSDYIKNNLALSYIMSDDYGQAVALLKPMAESKQSTQTVRQNLALAYGMQGDETSAKSWMLKDLSEEKATENLAFYKHYSKERIVSRHSAVSTQTASDTAVESVEVSDLSMPKSLLDTTTPPPAQPGAQTPPAAASTTMVSMTPVFKPVSLAKTTAPTADETTAQQTAMLQPKTTPAPKVSEAAFTAKVIFKPGHAKTDSQLSDIKPVFKPLAEVEPAAGASSAAMTAQTSPLSGSFAEGALPRPFFKPRLDE